MDKHTIRNTLIETRDSLDPSFVSSSSHIICGRLLDLPELQDAVIGSYLAVGHEVNLEHLHQRLWEAPRACFVPRILSNTEMEWARIESIGDLTVGTYGIPTSLRDETAELDDLDVLIMPCTGFDRRLNRLGMGGGYYDRALSKSTQSPVKIGVAFSQQEWPEIPVDRWDQPFDLVVTECEVIRR